MLLKMLKSYALNGLIMRALLNWKFRGTILFLTSQAMTGKGVLMVNQTHSLFK
jgi:hypothetical protein